MNGAELSNASRELSKLALQNELARQQIGQYFWSQHQQATWPDIANQYVPVIDYPTVVANLANTTKVTDEQNQKIAVDNLRKLAGTFKIRISTISAKL